MDSIAGMGTIAADIFIAVVLVAAILYVFTLWRLLSKCALQSRTLNPALAWLLLVPYLNVILNFYLVLGTAQTLDREFRLRAIPDAPREPAKNLGLAMCIFQACILIPKAGVAAGLPALILWMTYWSKLSEYSRTLDASRNKPPTAA